MRKVIPQKFFNGDTRKVAQELLGKFLVRRIGNREISGMITEVEAYDGVHDKASHASRGKTPRTEIMFGKPGYFYVYLTYGMHFMLNIITREHGYPAGILIRGVKEISGPGRLTKQFKIDKKLNGKPAIRSSGLWFEDRGVEIRSKQIKRTPRIGVAYAGPVWSQKLWRFVLEE
jgi:DNA-3-methyladenine glycosylase